jgi:glycosyltransferase involved in cell wall biosynthesis
VTRPGSRLRIFVASAAELLTDHAPHGEGLIAWETLSTLAGRGHELVVCARATDLRATPPFEVVASGPASHRESIEPVAYARWANRLYAARGGGRSFDAVHWLFPQEPLCFSPQDATTYVIGPWSSAWPAAGIRRPRRPGDLVRAAMAPYLARARERAFSRADRILLSAPHAAGHVPASARGRATVVPFGVDARRFSPAPLPDVPVLLFVGRLEPAKGIRQLVDGFGEAARTLPDARLLLAGEGSEREWIERRARELSVSDRVELLGRVPHVEVPELLRGCSALCLPAREEPFGMVVLEAMACARAVIAASDGGPGWLVDHGKGGLSLTTATAAELGAAIVELLGDPARLEALGRYNRDRVEAAFTLDRVADALEQAYRGGPVTAPAPVRATSLVNGAGR